MTTTSTNFTRSLRAGCMSGAMLLAFALAGCAAPPAPSPASGLPFDEAVVQAADALVAQTRQGPALFAKIGARRALVLDPMVDATSDQQTAATQRLQLAVAERIAARHDALELLPLQSASLARARYLLSGTLKRLALGEPRASLRIDLALTELGSGMVVAQSSAVARDEGLDATPLRYDRDMPVPVSDPVIEGYVRTAATPAGQRADPTYLAHIAAAPAIQQATTLYNAERYQDALVQYSAAGATPAGEQLRVLNGIYLSSAKLGRTAEAEQAFGRIVAHGIASRQLRVKFLFNPGGTMFWSEARISGPYAMWLREIARASAEAKVCMDVVGHTSRTGSVAFNDALSLQRARYIRERLVGESGVLGERIRSSGVGFRENLVGSGTDDAVDALDRRVEFRIVRCG